MARVNIDQQKKLATARRLAGRLHRRTVNEIFNGAKHLVPRGSHLSGSGKRRPGQPLLQSLKRVERDRTLQLLTLIGSAKKYAASEHQGSKPHFIRMRGGKVLKFEWERGNFLLKARGKGRRTFFYFKSVHHPGNKRPVRYLTTPMHLYGRLHGYRTSSLGVNRSRLP